MRIVVNDIAASSGGALSILKDFYEYVRNNDNYNEWIFLVGCDCIAETDNIKVLILDKVKSSKIEKLKFDFITGRKYINGLNPDVVFSMQNIITFGVKAKQVLYVHQSIPFQKIKKFSFLNDAERPFAVYQYIIGEMIKMSVKKSYRTIVQTKWMKEAVIYSTKVNENKIVNILPNVKSVNDNKSEEKSEANNKSFFYPTGKGIYKNNNCIVDAVRILNEEGYNDFKVKLTIDGVKNTCSNIIYTGRISRQAVFEEYKKSVLLFPSYIETFGYPLAEARMMGAIILASDCPFSREVLDGYCNAYFFDPFSPSELAVLMKKIIDGEITKKNISNTNIQTNDSWGKVWKEITQI